MRGKLKICLSTLSAIMLSVSATMGVSADITVYEPDSTETAISTNYVSPEIASKAITEHTEVAEFYDNYTYYETQGGTDWFDTPEWHLKGYKGDYDTCLCSPKGKDYFASPSVMQSCATVNGCYVLPCVDYIATYDYRASKATIEVLDIYGAVVGVDADRYKQFFDNLTGKSHTTYTLAIPDKVSMVDNPNIVGGTHIEDLLNTFQYSLPVTVVSSMRSFEVVFSDEMEAIVAAGSEYLPIKAVDLNPQFKATLYNDKGDIYIRDMYIPASVTKVFANRGIADRDAANNLTYIDDFETLFREFKVHPDNPVLADKRGVLVNTVTDTLIYYPFGKVKENLVSDTDGDDYFIIDEASNIGFCALDSWHYISATGNINTDAYVVNRIYFDSNVHSIEAGAFGDSFLNLSNTPYACSGTMLMYNPDIDLISFGSDFAFNSERDVELYANELSVDAFQTHYTEYPIGTNTTVNSNFLLDVLNPELAVSLCPCVVKGDANADGAVSIVDIIIESKYNVNSNVYPMSVIGLGNGDINNDNCVDNIDVSILLDYCSGSISSLDFD